MRENKALFLDGKRNLVFSNMDMPEPQPGEVLLQVDYVGVCGSDVHFYETGYIGTTRIAKPQIIGHECSATVLELGSGVTSLQPGDRVAVEPGRACGKCSFCKEGKYNLCRKMVFISSYPDHGVLRSYISYPADLCFKLGEGISQMHGAMIEPLAVGVHACRRGGVGLGQSIVIIGCGCIGLMTLLAARAMNPACIIVSDIFESRLQVARELGADVTVNARNEDLTQIVLAHTEGLGADITFEAAGNPKTVAQTITLTKPGGNIVTVGNAMGDTPFDFYQFGKKELTLKSVFRYRNIYPVAIRALESGQISLDRMRVDMFGFSEAPAAFESALNDKEHVLKAMIDMHK